MVPGSVNAAPPASGVGLTRLTLGTAWASVQLLRDWLAWRRAAMPAPATSPASTRAPRPIWRKRRLFGGVTGSEDIEGSSGSGMGGTIRRRRTVFGVKQAEQDRDQEQGGAGGDHQAADHGAAQRRVLTRFDRHRQHTDDHRQRRHQYRTKPGAAGFHGSVDRSGALGHPLAGE